jgi:hypothetical protein
VLVFVFVKVVLCRRAGLGMRAAIVSTGKGRVIKEEQLEGVGEGGWKETRPEGRMGGVEVQVPWVYVPVLVVVLLLYST